MLQGVHKISYIFRLNFFQPLKLELQPVYKEQIQTKKVKNGLLNKAWHLLRFAVEIDTIVVNFKKIPEFIKCVYCSYYRCDIHIWYERTLHLV